MTAAIPTRPDVLSVHSVDEFVFSVPALEEARHFYTSFGLDVRDEGDALALYTHGHPHRWARVFQHGEVKRLAWLTLGIHAQDEESFERHLAEREVVRIVPPAGADAGGIWIEGPDSIPLQLLRHRFRRSRQHLAVGGPPGRGLALCLGACAPARLHRQPRTAGFLSGLAKETFS